MTLAVPAGAQTDLDPPLPAFLRDRGAGVATSMFGTYVHEGELLVYPFFEWYADPDLEYTPAELGLIGDVEHRGRYRASEALLFLGYGITHNLAVEFEAAVISASLRKAAADTSAAPATVRESGLGDVEMQVRWRFVEETDAHPEAFTFVETVFPSQRDRRLIGTQDWEYKVGVGFTRGFSWGTATFRLSGEYSGEEGKVDAGEYAFEYLKRLSPRWRVCAAIEGTQVDEVELITEMQWHFHRRAFLKMNNGLGLTTNATGFAPELGVMIAF
jgi:hypothetical protein